jgi:hypothetical protein
VPEKEPSYYAEIDEVLGRAASVPLDGGEPVIIITHPEEDDDDEPVLDEELAERLVYAPRSNAPMVSLKQLASESDLYTPSAPTGTPLVFDHNSDLVEGVKKNGDDRMSVEAEREMRLKVEEITNRAMGYEMNVRLDIGYLLEVINAYETGKL